MLDNKEDAPNMKGLNEEYNKQSTYRLQELCHLLNHLSGLVSIYLQVFVLPAEPKSLCPLHIQSLTHRVATETLVT